MGVAATDARRRWAATSWRARGDRGGAGAEEAARGRLAKRKAALARPEQLLDDGDDADDADAALQEVAAAAAPR